MRKLFLIAFVVSCSLLQAQIDSLIIPANSILKDLKVGDSLTYYQCHVEEATQQLSTVSGQTLTGTQQKYTITEKYVVKKIASGYTADYYAASLAVFPNRKFSALKIREKPYWGFKKEKEFVLTDKDLKYLIALEKKGKEAIEYDYAITKYNTNQLIIRQGKNFKQLVIDGNYILSKLLGK
ncbi:MAG: hypothetical protein H0W73_00655 [Bacteroidetes bacterium]|nr:hypothetical protein [Bacteroidota bacterium]